MSIIGEIEAAIGMVISGIFQTERVVFIGSVEYLINVVDFISRKVFGKNFRKSITKDMLAWHDQF